MTLCTTSRERRCPTGAPRRQAARVGVPSIRLHDLRHSWATLALSSGVNPKVVAEQLGHSSIAITLDTYSHVTPMIASQAAEQVASIIRGGGA
jgi:integrase